MLERLKIKVLERLKIKVLKRLKKLKNYEIWKRFRGKAF